jgi:putative endonuclease
LGGGKQTKAIGDLGESAAEEYVRSQGYRILERNFRCRRGEIDIIGEDGGVIAFLEVKTRSPRSYLPPADAVDADKRERIRRAAGTYLARYRDPSPRRFDIVSVILDDRDRVVEIHLERGAYE